MKKKIKFNPLKQAIKTVPLSVALTLFTAANVQAAVAARYIEVRNPNGPEVARFDAQLMDQNAKYKLLAQNWLKHAFHNRHNITLENGGLLFDFGNNAIEGVTADAIVVNNNNLTTSKATTEVIIGENGEPKEIPLPY